MFDEFYEKGFVIVFILMLQKSRKILKSFGFTKDQDRIPPFFFAQFAFNSNEELITIALRFDQPKSQVLNTWNGFI